MFDLQAKSNRPDFVACRGILNPKLSVNTLQILYPNDCPRGQELVCFSACECELNTLNVLNQTDVCESVKSFSCSFSPFTRFFFERWPEISEEQQLNGDTYNGVTSIATQTVSLLGIQRMREKVKGYHAIRQRTRASVAALPSGRLREGFVFGSRNPKYTTCISLSWRKANQSCDNNGAGPVKILKFLVFYS